MRIPKKPGYNKRKMIDESQESSVSSVSSESVVKHPKLEKTITTTTTTTTATTITTTTVVSKSQDISLKKKRKSMDSKSITQNKAQKTNSTRNSLSMKSFRVLPMIKINLETLVRNLNCLRPHQRNLAIQIAALPISHGMCLKHGIGSGKTKCAIGIVHTLRTVYNQLLNTPVLWITAKALVDFSKNEMLSLHATLKSTQSNQSTELDSSSLYHFINIEYVINHIDTYIKRYQNSKCIVIIDECHNLRNCNGKRYTEIFRFLKSCALRTFCMTATPFVNHPQDMAGPTNLVLASTGRPSYDYLPKTKSGWDEQFALGASDPVLKKFISLWSIYEESDENKKEHFPRVERRYEVVRMTSEHEKEYKILMMERRPKSFRRKSKKKTQTEEEKAMTREFSQHQIEDFNRRINSGRVNLNDAHDIEFLAYMMRMRQYCNRTVSIVDGKEVEFTPKIDYVVNRIREMYATRDHCRIVVYSNFLENGIDVYKRKLRAGNIPFIVLTGKENNAASVIESFNSQDKCVLLLSSAGCQGLNLKRGTVLFITEVHFNECRMIQIEGRVIRFDGHKGMIDPLVEIIYVSLVPKDFTGSIIRNFTNDSPVPSPVPTSLAIWRTADEYMMDHKGKKQTNINTFDKNFTSVRMSMSTQDVIKYHRLLFHPTPVAVD